MKPSSKDVSCAFILNQLTDTLLATTKNLTGALTGTLGGLNLLGQNNMNTMNYRQQSPYANYALGNDRRNEMSGQNSGGGLLGLGLGIGGTGQNSHSGGGGLLGIF